ncbi:MAG: flagellar hook-associated protein FlgK [Blastomonas sp.]
MTDLLSIGRSGLRAYARSLETVSHNIANSQNPDYVRRSVQLGDATVSGRLNPLYASSVGLNGVTSNGVIRSADEFLETQVRLSGASRVRTETNVTWLERIETGLDNAGTNVGTTLNGFFARSEELAAAPFDTALRLTFLTDLETTADAFRRTSSNLQIVQGQLLQGAQSEALQLNTALNSLARINLDITRTPAGSDAHAGLLDARDSALTVISEKLDAQISLSGNGVATVTFDGNSLVSLGVAADVTIGANADGSFAIVVNGTAVRSPANGTLAGLSNASVQTTTKLAELDDLAQQFVDDVNAWQANGRTDANVPGGALLAMTGGASTLVVTTQNVSDLALASSDGSPNGNLLTLSAMRDGNGVETRWNNLMAGHANALAAARSESAAASALDRSAREARDNLSRVDIDREAADLIRLQQAYEASARVIQVARETLDSLLAVI